MYRNYMNIFSRLFINTINHLSFIFIEKNKNGF